MIRPLTLTLTLTLTFDVDVTGARRGATGRSRSRPRPPRATRRRRPPPPERIRRQPSGVRTLPLLPTETVVRAAPEPAATPREDQAAAASVVLPDESPRAYDDLAVAAGAGPGRERRAHGVAR